MNPVRFIAIFFVVLAYATFDSEAEEGPELVWEYETANPITSVILLNDSNNISATHSNKISTWIKNISVPYDNKTVASVIDKMVMSSDGRYILTSQKTERTVTLWENGTKKWEKTNFVLQVIDISISANGSYISVVDFRNVYLFDNESKNHIWTDNPRSSDSSEVMTSVSISPDGNYIAAGTDDGDVFLYSKNSSSHLWLRSGSFDLRVTDIDFGSNSDYFIVGTKSGRVHVFESIDSYPIFSYQFDSIKVTRVLAGSNSTLYSFGNEEGNLFLISSELNSLLWSKNIGSDGVGITGIVFNWNASYILAGSDSNSITLVNVSTGVELWQTATMGEVTSVALSHGGEDLAIGTSEGLSLYYESQLDNYAPVSRIESVSSLVSLPETPVTFTGSSIDYDGEVVEFLWSSNLDGFLSNESHFTVSNLSIGYHIISFVVKDQEGLWSFPAIIDVGIGDFPTAHISSISDCNLSEDCLFDEESWIEFVGSATSQVSEDPIITRYVWTSNIDGILSFASNFTISNLSQGSHLINFRVQNNFDFWSTNATIVLNINGLPIVNIVNSEEPIFSELGSSIILKGNATDPDGGLLTYIWLSDLEGGQISDKIEFTITSLVLGEHNISFRAVDENNASSHVSHIVVHIISPPNVSATCTEDANINDDLLFTAAGSDQRPGYIVKYEWDFNSSNGNFDSEIGSLDYAIGPVATHSYDKIPLDSYYLVVVRVTDNDGLTSKDTCTVFITEGKVEIVSNDGDTDVSISQRYSSNLIIGVAVTIVFVTVGIIVRYRRQEFESLSYEIPVKKELVSSSNDMKSIVPVRTPVRKRVVRKIIEDTETINVECPECSSIINVLKTAGSQSIQCPDCGLEGEIDL